MFPQIICVVLIKDQMEETVIDTLSQIQFISCISC